MTATTTYAYGDGYIDPATQLDNGDNTILSSELQYSFCPTSALQHGDPNRLISERRWGSDAAMGPFFKKEYWYDPSGNRLAMRESTPAAEEANDTPTKITRYNYWFMPKTDFVGEADRPFMPLTAEPFLEEFSWSGGESMTTSKGLDYAGVGQNKLVSKEVFDLNDLNHATATRYEYKAAIGEDGLADPYNWNFLAVSARVVQQAEWDEQGEYWTDAGSSTMPLLYDKDMQMISAGGETYQYDIFGRRWTRDTGERNYDLSYDGQQVTAEYQFRKLYATYTYGAFGPAIRTDCKGNNNDPINDDEDAWYLWDATGNAVGMLIYDETSQTWPASFQVFDAFGNLLAAHTATAAAAGAYAWRGAEGSENDSAYTDPEASTGLVYMQARYYDPEIGRFMNADILPMASLTSQALNRYIYCENDPVNCSDPAGTSPAALLNFLGALLNAVGVSLALMGNVLSGLIAALLGNICWLISAATNPEFLASLRALMQWATAMRLLASAILILILVTLIAAIYAAFAAPLVAAAVLYSIALDTVMYELETGADVSPYVQRAPGWRDDPGGAAARDLLCRRRGDDHALHSVGWLALAAAA